MGLKYYVYTYLRNDGTPYYVGKGNGNRAYDNHGRIPVPKDKANIQFYKTQITESEAFDVEIRLIKQYGKKCDNTGILLNIADGGQGSAGWKHTEDTKVEMSIEREERVWWNNGVKEKHTTMQPDSDYVLGRLSAFIEKNKPNTGKKYWNNGIKNIMAFDCPGDGFVSGQISTGKKWWNDGSEQIMAVDCPGDGFVNGMLKSKKVRWTNGEKIVMAKSCPGKGWWKGSLATVAGRRWWNDGTNTVYLTESPGEGWNNGRLG